MSSNKIRDALLEASIALSWATHNHLTSGDAEKYLKIVDDALSAPPRNCDRFSNANEALEAFEKEKGETMIEFIRWLFAEAKGETDGSK